MLFGAHRQVVVLFNIVQDGKTLVVSRGEFSCLPGGPIKDSEDIDVFAANLLSGIVSRPHYYRLRHVVADRFDGEWDGAPASILVVEYPFEQFHVIPENGARWTDIRSPDENFDVFVKKFAEDQERDRQYAESFRISA